MLKTILKMLNDNHWYVIAACLLLAAILWTYGCESQVCSLLDETKKVNRAGLENELRYLTGVAEVRITDLDKQDEIKQSLLDAANAVGTTGQINPSGLLNLAAAVGGITFGLSQRQKLKAASTEKTTNTA